MFKRWVVVIAVFAVGNSARAGEITIVGTSKLALLLSDSIVSLQGSYEMENRGNEGAKEVFPALDIGGWSWVGDPKFIAPKTTARWDVQQSFPLEKLACTEDASFCTALPGRGAVPVFVRKHYQDLNGYRFSSPEVLRLEIGALSAEEQKSVRAPALDAKLAFSGPGQRFDGTLEIYNLSGVPQTALFSVFAPRELQVRSQPTVITVPPGGPVNVPVTLENFRGLDGSVYAVFVVLQWAEGGVRNALPIAQGVKIAPPDKGRYYLAAGAAVIALLFGLLYLFVFRRSTP